MNIWVLENKRKRNMLLCRFFFLFLFLLHQIKAKETAGKPLSNKSQGKVYLYFKQATTPQEAEKICKDHSMKLLSVEQEAEKSWLEKIVGSFLGLSGGPISAFVCEKNDVTRINNFNRNGKFPHRVNEISNMLGNRIECAVHCSDILLCDIFTYASNGCQFYSKGDGSGNTLPCDRLQCYVKL